MIFDPDSYTITIRKEKIDDELLYVGHVAEFQNISAYEETYEEARSILIDAIETLKLMADKEGAAFPDPLPPLSEEYSGRPSLRLPKSLHAKIAKVAERDGVSLNTCLVDAVSAYVGESNALSRASKEFSRGLVFLLQGAATLMISSGHAVLKSSNNSIPTLPPSLTLTSGLQFGEGQWNE
jgi:predicted RNase H-like HicB family nuclease